jgi:hypothetical protein
MQPKQVEVVMGTSLRVIGVVIALLSGLSAGAAAQAVRGVVVDQTGLPLPGATVELVNGTTVVVSLLTGPDGTFEIPADADGPTVVVKLDGFAAVTISRSQASRVVLPLATASETTEVVAPLLPTDSPAAPLLGGALVASDIARLPSARLQARESLPLLPSVVRGPDGLLRLGGARPSESPLLIDGFDVTDPATGLSSINLPFEVVQGIEVLRDPTAVTYGSMLGALVKIETKTGREERDMGIQGFIPRPRFQKPGLGRIEGIFPRFFVSGKAGTSRVRYFGAVEYDFERIHVPDVTQGSGPHLVEESASIFGRVDIQATGRSQLTFHGLVFPSSTDFWGISTRREEAASPNISGRDMFGGVTSRTSFSNSTLLTIRAGVSTHVTNVRSNGSGLARVSPSGWRNNWFSNLARHAIRYSFAAGLERSIRTRGGSHDLGLHGSIHARRLRGSVIESAVQVEDDRGTVVRALDFDRPSTVGAHDWPYGLALRDVWKPNDRIQVDLGARIDGNSVYGAVPSARTGIRFEIDEAGLTVIKGGVGRFVGNIPLAVPAFAGYPARFDWRLDEATGRSTTVALQPAVDRLRLPHAEAVTLQLERQLRPGLDAQVGFTRRNSSRLATLDVPADQGQLAVRSTGTSSYREFQVSMRQTWADKQQVFVSYVRSSARGELNDFMGLFGRLDAPLLQPGGLSRLPADARHRLLVWGTINAPGKLGFSPVMEWHSGFPYSALDDRQLYYGEPNSREFPSFMAVDLVAFKTVTVRDRMADVGIQLFNVTNYFNPRDVYPVVGTANYGAFTNSVGTILRGFMLIKW